MFYKRDFKLYLGFIDIVFDIFVKGGIVYMVEDVCVVFLVMRGRCREVFFLVCREIG